jgi:membrane-associated phospholipid phosphatase
MNFESDFSSESMRSAACCWRGSFRQSSESLFMFNGFIFIRAVTRAIWELTHSWQAQMAGNDMNSTNCGRSLPQGYRFQIAGLLLLWAAVTAPLTQAQTLSDTATQPTATTPVPTTPDPPGQAPQAAGQRSSPSPDARDPNVYLSNVVPKRPFVKKFTYNFLLDQKAIWTSPFHSGSSAKWWLLAGAGTAALLAVDHEVSQALPFSGTSVDFGNAASRAGQWYSVFPAAGAFVAVGQLTGNDKAKETGILSLEALADADLVTEVLKVATRRQRPVDGDHGGHFEEGGSSFPSGHSTQAWALAAVIADEYSDKKWVPFVAYSYATLISVSRVLAQEHFTSDVFVGGMIGFFVGRYVVHTQHVHREHVHDGKPLRSFVPDVMPTFSPSAKTVTLTWRLY